MANNLSVNELKWDSEFFNKCIGSLALEPNLIANEAELIKVDISERFDLVQAKVSANDYSTINALNTLGFSLVEGEIDFSLNLSEIKPKIGRAHV